MPESEIDVAAIAGAIGGLKAEVKSLRETTSSGFAGVNRRLDRQNDRIGTVESATTKIAATMVTTKICEGLRDVRDLALNRAERLRSANWRSYVVPSAVGVTVAAATILIAKLTG